METVFKWLFKLVKLHFSRDCMEIEWKRLMSECLIEAEISKKNKYKTYFPFDPNSVMDLRHKIVKETKIFHVPQVQIHSEALELLRVKNKKMMLQQKEERIVEKEIAKLKQSFDSDRFFIEKRLDDATTRSKHNPQKFIKYSGKWKRLESHDSLSEVDTLLCWTSQMRVESKFSIKEIPTETGPSAEGCDLIEEFLEPVPSLEGSVTRNDFEHVMQLLGADEGKSEIMKKFFHHAVNQEWENNKEDNLIRVLQEIQKKMEFRRVKHAWNTWKAHTIELKNREKEKGIYRSKIEAFLSNLEAKKGEDKEVNIIGNKNHEKGMDERLRDITKIRKNQTGVEMAEKNLKKLMKEVKTSQAEARQKLQEISKAKLKSVENLSDVTFLKRMEKRREERLKQWTEIREKKRKLEDEKKNTEKLKELEEKRKEEENRRKKLEEAKLKERFEREKKEEKAREKEVLSQKMKVAENHHKKYLLRKCGLRPWIALVKIRISQWEKTSEFFEKGLIRKTFDQLKASVREKVELKVKRADEFHDRILKRKYLHIWTEFFKEKIKQYQVAVDWNELKLTEKTFRKWLKFTQNEQLEYLIKLDIAQLHYERRTKVKYLKKLRDYPKLKKLEQAKENRKWKWRQRVKEILPDYQPVEIFDAEKRTQFLIR